MQRSFVLTPAAPANIPAYTECTVMTLNHAGHSPWNNTCQITQKRWFTIYGGCNYKFIQNKINLNIKQLLGECQYAEDAKLCKSCCIPYCQGRRKVLRSGEAWWNAWSAHEHKPITEVSAGLRYTANGHGSGGSGGHSTHSTG